MAAAFLAGMTATSGLGEQSVSPDLLVQLMANRLVAEGYFSPADKLESPGWLASGSADVKLGPARLGVGYSKRHTKAWDKDATWARAGIANKLAQLMLMYDLTSPNKVSKAELRLQGNLGHLLLEPHGFVESYRDGAGQRRTGYGVGLRAGVGF